MNRPIKPIPAKQKRAIEIRRLVPAREVMNGRIERVVRLAAGDRELRALSVVLADDATLASLHEQYMADASPTDVLTFDLRDDGGEAIEGEVVISVDTARREARQRRIEVGQEVLRYIIHGTLHLVGYDDHTSGGRRRMRQEEDRVLELLNASMRSAVRSGKRSALRKR